jgi:hypothetical protein
MDFNYKKPSHIFALFLVILSLILFVVLPIISFVQGLSVDPGEEYQQLPENIRLLTEILIVVFQLALVFFFMIAVPIIWYLLVNDLSIKQSLKRMRLTLERIDEAILFGFLGAISIYALFFLIEFLVLASGMVNPEDLSNVPELDALFSPSVLVLLVVTQPIAEEIYFRGFILEKVEGYGGIFLGLVISSILFGIAHIGYNKELIVALSFVMGLILGFIVIKTKNLYSSIFAHIAMNSVVIVLYLVFEYGG